MTDQTPSDLGEAIQEVTEKVQLLVREEMALAKAELTEKVSKLIRGIVAGAIAAIFAIFGLIYLLHALSWGIWEILGTGSGPWLGFLITGVVILLVGAICALIAYRLIKRGSPPTPQMAIEEAQLIKGTLTAAPAAHMTGPVGARQAPAPAPAERKG